MGDQITQAVEKIAAVYEFSPCGGCCHLVIDDGNTDDDDIEFCQEYLASVFNGNTQNDQYEAESACLLALKGMGELDRQRAIALYHGQAEPEAFPEVAPVKDEKQAPAWWADIRTDSLVVIDGHWFEITGMGPLGLVLKYREPTGKTRKVKKNGRSD